MGFLLAAASGAFACTNLAVLNLSAAKGAAGARITASGMGFSTAAPVVPVVLRWNGADGAELARVAPDRQGEFTASFDVPQAVPGYYVVVAVQRDAGGVDRYGTPARASYQILGPSEAPTTRVLPPSTTSTTRPRPSTTTTSAPTNTSTTTTAAPVAPVSLPTRPVAARQDRPDDLPAPAVAAGILLLTGAAVGLRVVRSRP
jgi:hypothetical protein